MATYHFTLKSDKRPDKNGKKGAKVAASEHIEYINREGKYEDYDKKSRQVLDNYITTTDLPNMIAGSIVTLYDSPYGKIVNMDRGLAIENNPSHDTILLALTMAKMTMGEQIIVHGSALFKEKCIKAALDTDYDVDFAEAKMNDTYRKRKEAIVRERREFEANGGTHKVPPNISQSNTNDTSIAELKAATVRGSLTSMRELSERYMDGARQANAELLLQGNESYQLEQPRAYHDASMRWSLSRGRRKGAVKVARRILKNIELQRSNIYAASHIEYINREKAFASRGGCVYKSHRLPKWAGDSPNTFFKAADRYSGKNGVRYKEIEFALQNELTLEQNVELIEKFIAENLPNCYYTYAVHDKIGAMSDGTHNIHCHLTFSPRIIDDVELKKERKRSDYFKYPLRENAKDQSEENKRKHGAPMDKRWLNREAVPALRESFARITNEVLEKYGHSARVDHRTLKAQRDEALMNGDVFLAKLLDRIPEEHISPHSFLEERNPDVERIKKYRQYKERYQDLLFEADVLMQQEHVIERSTTGSKLATNVEKVINSNEFVEASNDSVSLIGELRDNFIVALDDFERVKKNFMTKNEAMEIARIEKMTAEERETHAYYKEAKEELSHWRTFQKNLKPPSTDDAEVLASYAELVPAIAEKVAKLEDDVKKYGEREKEISLRLSEAPIKKAIQIHVHNLLKQNNHDAYDKAEQQLSVALRQLEQALFEAEASENAKEIFSTRDLYNIVRRRYFAKAKEIDRLKPILNAASKKVISLERAYEMAQAKYLGGDTLKNINEENRKLGKKEGYLRNDIAKHNADINDFNKLTPLAADNINYAQYIARRDELSAKSLELRTRADELKNARADLTARQNAIKARLNTPEAIEKVAKILEGILRKNEPHKARYTKLKLKFDTAMNDVKQIKTRMDTLKAALKTDKDGKMRYKVVDTPKSSGGGSVNFDKPNAIADAIHDHNAPVAILVARSHEDRDGLKNWTLMTEAEKQEELEKASKQYI